MNRFAEAIERSGVDVVPKMVIGGRGEGEGGLGGSSIVEALLATLLSDRLLKLGGVQPTSPRSSDAAALRAEIVRGIEKKE